MSKYLNRLVVGIDVASEFSFAAFLAPDGSKYRKPFKIFHTADGFKYFLEQIKKAEEEFSTKPVFFMESTGVYHLTLFHFLKDNNFETFVINPLVTNCNKNKDIRKVKNDRNDALSIANLGKFEDIKVSSDSDIKILTLKLLVRDYYKLIDTRSVFKKKLSSSLCITFNGYQNVFANTCGLVSINILKQYPSPQAIISAPKQDIMYILLNSRKGVKWAETKYTKLIESAENAEFVSLPAPWLSVSITTSISIYEAIDAEIATLFKKIDEFINSDQISPTFRKNILLLMSIPGIGYNTAITILAEIGGIDRFITPKQLVAFFGVDPAVNESGKFKGDRVKMSKRGTRFGRRALYAAALASIRIKRNGEATNEVLLKYYKENLKGKKAKVALVAVMHKLIKYLFAVLRNQEEYQVRDPKIHQKMFLENNSIKVA
ncbi:IS110 family transposase [Clostridium lacusfryxellense]|uniref:IS110 family transposase n=1 Tax=Clostridium lacusfryxellense TaxID=205328 RepID=UPI001C0B514B|nr:IS110 family transposase [Clostridium lacusfryxellense]MBU3114853.1 IS110 family transposase [Clostridium lacusfryxellense]